MIRGSNGDRMCTAPAPLAGVLQRLRAAPNAPACRRRRARPAPTRLRRTLRLDQAADRGLARRIEMADRIEADEPLRAQRAIEQIVGGFAASERRLRRLVPAEMPRHQLIGLQHAGALADRQRARVERQLQRPLRRLAARPGMILFDQHVVVDVADRQRAVAPDQPHAPCASPPARPSRTICGPRADAASSPAGRSADPCVGT